MMRITGRRTMLLVGAVLAALALGGAGIAVFAPGEEAADTSWRPVLTAEAAGATARAFALDDRTAYLWALRDGRSVLAAYPVSGAGRPAWTTVVDAATHVRIAIHEGTLVLHVSCGDSCLRTEIVDAATGARLWQRAIPPGDPRPIGDEDFWRVRGGFVSRDTRSGVLTGLDLRSGRPRWTYRTAARDDVRGVPSREADSLLVRQPDGRVRLVAGDTGRVRSSGTLPRTPAREDCPGVYFPVTADRELITVVQPTAAGVRVTALRAADLAIRWQRDLPASCDPLTGTGVLDGVVTLYGGGLPFLGLDPATGAERWRRDGPFNHGWHAGPHLVLQESTGGIRAEDRTSWLLDGRTGTQIAAFTGVGFENVDARRFLGFEDRDHTIHDAGGVRVWVVDAGTGARRELGTVQVSRSDCEVVAPHMACVDDGGRLAVWTIGG